MAWQELTYQQKQILLRFLNGESDQIIAENLNIVKATVRKHIQHICDTLLGQKRTHAGQPSRRRALIQLAQEQQLVLKLQQHLNGALEKEAETEVITKKTLLDQSPIQENPYMPWQAVTPPQFVGRKDELSKLKTALEDQRSISLVGDWRIGKTSVLTTWSERARTRDCIVKLVNAEEGAGASQASLVKAITNLEVPTQDSDQVADILQEWAKEQCRHGLHPLVLIDEFDGLLKRCESRFFERLRGMLGDLNLVLASRQMLDTAFIQGLGHTSPFGNQLQIIQLGLIEPEAANSIIQWGSPFFNPDDIQDLQDIAGRHPYYLQLLGRHLVDSNLQKMPKEIALKGFWSDASARLRELWSVLTEREREALRKLQLKQEPVKLNSLKMRGLVNVSGHAFGRVLIDWLQEHYESQ